MGVGVSINPATPVSVLEEVLPDIDLVLVMSVNPGFGGQSLIPSTLNKIRKLDELRISKDYDYLIEIDGGVKLDNIDEVAATGVDIVVAGSAVFNVDDIADTVREFKSIGA